MDSSRVPIILGLFIVVVVSVMYFFSFGYKPAITATAIGPFSLNQKNTIITDKDSRSFYTDSYGSFSAFLNLESLNRTGSYSACGTEPNQASCDDGSFAPCPCENADCSVCDHSGYMTVLSIGGVVELEVLSAPDASRQGKAMAQLIIKTQGATITNSTGMVGRGGMNTTPQQYMETFVLPPVSLQKWVMVTIAREGRRFDVYYNDTIVLSQKTMYMPVSNSSNTNMQGITSGSDAILGKLAIANMYNYRVSTLDVSAKYNEYADTRGAPRIPTDLLSSLSVNICSQGGCFDAPVIKPASPLYDWSTSYN